MSTCKSFGDNNIKWKNWCRQKCRQVDTLATIIVFAKYYVDINVDKIHIDDNKHID